MAEQYPISTLREMTAIPDEALERFAAELPSILREARRFYQFEDRFNTAFGGELKMSDQGPVWVDDDLNQVTVTVETPGSASMSITSKRGA